MKERTFLPLLLMLSSAIIIGCGAKQNERNKTDAPQSSTTPPASQVAYTQKISQKTVEGTVSGFDCAVVDVLCPSTHRAADFTAGLFTDKNEWFFVVNIPQSFLTQYFLEKMSVTGKTYHPYDTAIEPEQMYILKDGEKKLVYDAGYFFDPQGHKAMFNEGRIVNGRWVCDKCARKG
jgi:hypothetical protein